MAFTFNDTPPDIAATLRELEAAERKLPSAAKALLIMAATTLEDQRKLLEDISSELSAASNLRVGMMDSQSRADEVARHIKSMMASLDRRIRELLSRPHVMPLQPKPEPDSAVI